MVWAIHWPQGTLGLRIYEVGIAAILVNIFASLAKRWMILPGLLCNATAVFVNNGMPVIGKPLEHPSPLHHMATAVDQLPFLWDRFAGFSIGDIVLGAGFLTYLGFTWRRRGLD